MHCATEVLPLFALLLFAGHAKHAGRAGYFDEDDVDEDAFSFRRKPAPLMGRIEDQLRRILGKAGVELTGRMRGGGAGGGGGINSTTATRRAYAEAVRRYDGTGARGGGNPKIYGMGNRYNF